jgi:hypothetical protein
MIVFCPRCGSELHEVLKGEWFESPVRCADCGLAVADPPLMLARGSSEEEVEYSLVDWQVPERALATRGLVEVDIPYRWEAGLVLVVPSVAEEEVDLLFEDLAETDEPAEGESADTGDSGSAADVADAEDVDVDEDAVDDDDDDDGDDDGGEDDDDDDGGEEAQEAMSDLFVAADRLQHAPSDQDVGDELSALAAIVDASAPPYGIARPVWRRIQALSAAVAGDLAEGTDEDTVATDARALRDFLRDLV